MKLVDNWKDGWKWLSVHALVILAAVPLIWMQIPTEWKAAAIPQSSMVWVAVAVAVAVCGIIARLFKEGKLSFGSLSAGKSWFSVWALFFAAAIPLVWTEIPPDLIASLPAKAVTVVTTLVSVIGLVGRFIDQSSRKQQV